MKTLYNFDVVPFNIPIPTKCRWIVILFMCFGNLFFSQNEPISDSKGATIVGMEALHIQEGATVYVTAQEKPTREKKVEKISQVVRAEKKEESPKRIAKHRVVKTIEIAKTKFYAPQPQSTTILKSSYTDGGCVVPANMQNQYKVAGVLAVSYVCIISNVYADVLHAYPDGVASMHILDFLKRKTNSPPYAMA